MLDFFIILVFTTISADGPFTQSRSHIYILFYLNNNNIIIEIMYNLSNTL